MIALQTTLLALAIAASAKPISLTPLLRSLPVDADVAAIAFDEVNDMLIAYQGDGTVYGSIPASNQPTDTPVVSKRAAATCSNLSVDEVKALPGWNAITQYAKDNWGNGKYNLETNPDGYLDYPAQGCIDGEPISVTKKADPQCVTQTTVTDGQLVGASGSIALQHWQGFTNTGSWTVTKSSSIGVDVKLSASFKIPELFDAGVETTTRTDFTNTLSSTFSTTVDTKQTQTLTVEAEEGKKCHVEFKTNTCNVEGTGKIRNSATGWIWFNYEDKTQGHYKWAVHIDTVIKNIDDRSSFTEFTGSMAGDAYSSFAGKCE